MANTSFFGPLAEALAGRLPDGLHAIVADETAVTAAYLEAVRRRERGERFYLMLLANDRRVTVCNKFVNALNVQYTDEDDRHVLADQLSQGLLKINDESVGNQWLGPYPFATAARELVGLSDELLVDLIDHFSRVDLRNSAVPNDVLGNAYEYLIKKFADLTNRKAGEFYTPRAVVELMVRMLAPRAGETVYDPACGTGGMLLETLHQVREAGGDERLMLRHLFGQEKNLTTAAIARMNLFLHGAEDFEIVRGDTLRQPAFLSADRLATFDCVIANPPFSLSAWGEDAWSNDPWGRNLAGTPPQKYGDWAWVQHMIASMAPATGRMAVVLPHGALFRMGAEGKIRSKVLEMDLIEAVIGLGANLFYGTSLAACILVARRRKSKERRNKVLLIDGSDLFRKGRNQNGLEREHVEWLLNSYEELNSFEEFAEVDGRSRVVPLEEIRKQGGSLNLAGYVRSSDETEIPTVAEATAAVQEALEVAWAAEDRLNMLLAERGIA